MSLMEDMLQYNKQDLYEDVCTFNRLAGKDFAVSKEDLLKQVRQIQEELDETRKAIEESNPVEILDGTIDIAFTLFGLMQQLENSGYRVNEAGAVTAHNNLSKFVHNKELANKTVESLQEKEPSMRFRVEENIEGFDIIYVIKDQFDKVRKPLGYIKNDVSRFVPEWSE